ncbi:MarR family winged helix-turn-helix transcriptional regulator [Sulfitobacter aestuariivivens]|uniref:MarR family transcriptional regulator n=1 Tax=Sulfitobacter aestuariivivens TaxID=2766981 RepID=A0A927HGR6_9RHOB|nr:MarR family transcriptional regulator [Sulfitobacter aestuariivivens]MBD3666281.1 MarR family transcriptional regulator [Sulfitobacter aestuariivivens]
MTHQDKSLAATEDMADTFGALSLVMLDDTDLRHAWRINFLANFFTGPVYRHLGEKFGITRPEFVILYCLEHMPGLVAQDICRVTGQPKNSISRAVSDLLEKGYVRRGTDPEDKRAKPLTLTEVGWSILEHVSPIVKARQDAMRAALTDEELAQFDCLLRKMVFAMPDWVTPE